jgi:hypothetical protein
MLFEIENAELKRGWLFLRLLIGAIGNNFVKKIDLAGVCLYQIFDNFFDSFRWLDKLGLGGFTCWTLCIRLFDLSVEFFKTALLTYNFSTIRALLKLERNFLAD